MNEFIAYDWNLFLSDLGGSLGFLLGLSVLSAIGVIEQILEIFIKKKNDGVRINNDVHANNNESDKELQNNKINLIGRM